MGCPIFLYHSPNIGRPIPKLAVEVAKLTEIPAGSMKSVKAFDDDILLSNVGGRMYATSNRCGHQNAPLARGILQGNVVTCPLHAAKFDVTTGQNLSGPQLMMSQDVMQKMPPEIIAMFKRTGEILSEIEEAIENLQSHYPRRLCFSRHSLNPAPSYASDASAGALKVSFGAIL